MTHYETLGVEPSATNDQLKSAYRAAAIKWHPDKHVENKDEAEKKFKEINESYDTLRDPDKRAQYDYSLKNPNQGPRFNNFQQGGVPPGFEDMFSHVFTNFSPGFYSNFKQQRQKNSDAHINLSVTIQEAFLGAEKIVQYSENNELKTLNVRIPPGIRPGNTLKLKDKAPKQNPSLPAGDILIHIKGHNITPGKDDSFIIINDWDLGYYASVPVFDLILGTTISITHMDGEEIIVTIPEGTKPKECITIANKGMPILNTPLRTNLVVEIGAVMPKNLPENIKLELAKINEGIKNPLK